MQDSKEENNHEEDPAKDSTRSVEVGVNDDLIKEEAMKTISSSKSLHSKHLGSIGGTSRSMSRMTKLHQRVLELNDKQKISKWEEILT